jgi:hypothetical protein
MVGRAAWWIGVGLKEAAQAGYKVFREVCDQKECTDLKRVAYSLCAVN